MDLEILIGWLVFFIHLIVFNIGWVYGLRVYMKNKGGFMKGTALAALLLTLETFIFLFSDISKLYMLLLTPIITYVLASRGLLQDLFSIPILSSILTFITKIFVSIVTIGVKTEKDPLEIDEAFEKDLSKMFVDIKGK